MVKASKIMTSGVVKIPPYAGLPEAAKLLISKSVSSLVVAENGRPVGVASETDILKGIVFKKKEVKDIVSKRYLLVSPETNFSEINNYLRRKNVKRFPVVQDDKLVGLITETDIVQAARDFTRLHHFVQETILVIFGIATVFFFFYFNPIW